ncbi:hypothetical protein BDB00DRAFT_864966, partial [Zychaea mexicana]|uniref:uncharacterized protein n=1 Tax=Zychaea mexicana TaxID=64656 RepID=UPI0022FF22C2
MCSFLLHSQHPKNDHYHYESQRPRPVKNQSTKLGFTGCHQSQWFKRHPWFKLNISDDKDGSQLHALDGGSNTKKNIVGKVKMLHHP